jgi:hypothetical protein
MIDYRQDLQDRIHLSIDELKDLTQFEIQLLKEENLEEAEMLERLIVELCVELDVLILVRGALYQIDFE